MADLYTDLQATASELIEQFGRSVSLVKPGYTGANQEFSPSSGTYVPTGGNQAGDPTSTTVKAVFVGIGWKWKDKFPIQQGDSIALVAADGAAPDQNDLLDGWTILGIDPLKPAGTTLLYKCHVRKQ